MRELAIYYDAASDYLRVSVPHAVTPRQLAIAAKAGYDIDRVRYAQAVGDKRELLGKRIAAYEAGRVRQVVTNPAGDASLFTATQGTGRIISLGA